MTKVKIIQKKLRLSCFYRSSQLHLSALQVPAEGLDVNISVGRCRVGLPLTAGTVTGRRTSD